MSFEDSFQDGETGQKTARTVGQLVKYSRELNRSETVEEVGTYAVEATFHVMDGHPTPTIVEVHGGDLQVLESMSPGIEVGGDPPPVARRAYETGNTVVRATGDVAVGYRTDDTEVVRPAHLGLDGVADGVAIASASVYEEDAGDVGDVVSVCWPTLDSVEEYHVKPIEYMADHVATAIDNVRSHERLERARDDLATRKDLMEMYDRLLRHDLGNDLQVIVGFSDALVGAVEAGSEPAEYAEKIRQTARGASDLVDQVGELVKTMEGQAEPEVRALRPVLAAVVEDVDAKYESLTVEFDPGEVEYRVLAGDLLESVFANVLANAATHNDEPVTVRVYADEPSPETVVVGFADDGTGVPGEVRDQIFEMGEKGPDSEGTGLGLGFVRALAETYGGGVDVGPSDRGGADFRVRLKRA